MLTIKWVIRYGDQPKKSHFLQNFLHRHLTYPTSKFGIWTAVGNRPKEPLLPLIQCSPHLEYELQYVQVMYMCLCICTFSYKYILYEAATVFRISTYYMAICLYVHVCIKRHWRAVVQTFTYFIYIISNAFFGIPFWCLFFHECQLFPRGSNFFPPLHNSISILYNSAVRITHAKVTFWRQAIVTNNASNCYHPTHSC